MRKDVRLLAGVDLATLKACNGGASGEFRQ